MIGNAPVVDSGTLVVHDRLGLATFWTTLGIAISVDFTTDGKRDLRAECVAENDHAMITFYNAVGPFDFNDFDLSFAERDLHLLIMVTSFGPPGAAIRQISYTLLDTSIPSVE